ncbi:hypothetical protein M885DRAFT_552353 [Pelagophyceae sp. CCMP2097]|nr:hypothetical protein M885DRAFT_552353 [Pelagophyceae sp. CCMP2097]
MRRASGYDGLLETLKLYNSAHALLFRAACASVAKLDAVRRAQVIDDVCAAATWVVDNPERRLAPPCRARGAAHEELLGVLGFAPRDGLFAYEGARTDVALRKLFAYEGARTDVALRKLQIAVRALRELEAVATAADALQPAAALRPEPPQGAAGTASINLVVDGRRHRRRFYADDVFETVIAWARTVDDELDAARLVVDGGGVFEAADASKTLQALGLWPGAALEARHPCAPPKAAAAKAAAPSTSSKPRPSDIFKAISQRHSKPTSKRDLMAKAHERRNQLTPAPAPAPA